MILFRSAAQTAPKVFLVSGSDINVVAAVTEKLGRARVQSSGEYDSSVTHIVIAKVCRSEKLLSCTAGGKWVLHPDYITDSEKVSFSCLDWPDLTPPSLPGRPLAVRVGLRVG